MLQMTGTGQSSMKLVVVLSKGNAGNSHSSVASCHVLTTVWQKRQQKMSEKSLLGCVEKIGKIVTFAAIKTRHVNGQLMLDILLTLA